MVASIDCPTTGMFGAPANSTHGRDRCVVFFHIPKVGGTTIEAIFKSSGYRLVVNPAPRWLESLDPQHCRGRTFIRLHAVSSIPSFREAVAYLPEVRARFASANRSFSVFVVLREPLPFSISMYHHLCGAYHHHMQSTCHRGNRSTVGMISTLRENMQCAYLLSSLVGGWLHSPVPKPTKPQCGGLLRDLINVSDRVATTDRLFKDLGWLDTTFSLGLSATLSRWLGSNKSLNVRTDRQTESDVLLAEEQAHDPRVIEKVRMTQSLDQQMYDCVHTVTQRRRRDFATTRTREL